MFRPLLDAWRFGKCPHGKSGLHAMRRCRRNANRRRGACVGQRSLRFDLLRTSIHLVTLKRCCLLGLRQEHPAPTKTTAPAQSHPLYIGNAGDAGPAPFMRDHGLPHALTMQVESPFDYKAIRCSMSPDNTPNTKSQSFDFITDQMEQWFTVAAAALSLLFTSNAALRYAVDKLRKPWSARRPLRPRRGLFKIRDYQPGETARQCGVVYDQELSLRALTSRAMRCAWSSSTRCPSPHRRHCPSTPSASIS